MNNELRDVLKAQRRSRRRNFWAGFAVLAVLGGLWAQLSKDPIGPNFDDGIVFEDAPAEPAFEEFEFEPATTIVEAPFPLATPPEPPSTGTTSPSTTVAP